MVWKFVFGSVEERGEERHVVPAQRPGRAPEAVGADSASALGKRPARIVVPQVLQREELAQDVGLEGRQNGRAVPCGDGRLAADRGVKFRHQCVRRRQGDPVGCARQDRLGQAAGHRGEGQEVAVARVRLGRPAAALVPQHALKQVRLAPAADVGASRQGLAGERRKEGAVARVDRGERCERGLALRRRAAGVANDRLDDCPLVVGAELSHRERVEAECALADAVAAAAGEQGLPPALVPAALNEEDADGVVERVQLLAPGEGEEQAARRLPALANVVDHNQGRLLRPPIGPGGEIGLRLEEAGAPGQAGGQAELQREPALARPARALDQPPSERDRGVEEAAQRAQLVGPAEEGDAAGAEDEAARRLQIEEF